MFSLGFPMFPLGFPMCSLGFPMFPLGFPMFSLGFPRFPAPGRSWPLLAAPGHSWPLLAARGRSWPPLAASALLAALGRSWPLLAAPGRSWPLLAAAGRSWPLLAIPGSFSRGWCNAVHTSRAVQASVLGRPRPKRPQPRRGCFCALECAKRSLPRRDVFARNAIIHYMEQEAPARRLLCLKPP